MLRKRQHGPVRPHYNFTLAILAAAALAYALQQTMVVPALPSLQRDLHTTTTWATWIFTAFLLSASVATPLLGKLGDQYGKERLLAITLVVFLVGCVGAAAAPDISTLIFFRILQGASGAVFPLSFAIIKDEFPQEKLAVGLGLVSTILGVGAAVGLVLSGVIVDNLSWRWIFVIGAIAAAIALVLVHRFVPESPIKTLSRVDVPGALLLSGGLVALLVALTEGNRWGWGSARTLGLIALSVVVLVVWVRVELRVPEPMVDIRMMVGRTVFFTNLTALFAGFSMYGAFVLVPAFSEAPRGLSPRLAHLVHYGFGASTTKTGVYLLPASLAVLFAGPAAGAFSRRVGSRTPLALGMVTIAAGTAIIAEWHSAPYQVMVALAVLGVGVGFAYAAMPKLITDAVDAHQTGVATGMNTVMRTIGGVVGGQVGAALLTSHTLGGTSVPAVGGFVAAFWAASAIGVVGAVAALGISTRRRALAVAPA
jgi:EmrB/QacA subfamily drug resistance transporter